MNLFEKYKQQSGMSYTDIGKEMGGITRGTAFSYVTNPGRSTLLTMLDVGRVLNIPPEEVRDAWKEAKKKAINEKIDNIANG